MLTCIHLMRARAGARIAAGRVPSAGVQPTDRARQ